MSALAAKLDRLRAQSGSARTLAAPAPSSAPLSPALNRLLETRSHRPRAAVAVAADRRVAGICIAPGLYCTELYSDKRPMPELLDVRFAHIEHPIATHRLLHFDTETTGLAGGTGTRAFMLGVADWQTGRLRLRQLTITTLAAESAMLQVFASWLHADAVLVSYNGKSYDAPLLATRYRLARQANPLTDHLHLDLLHPVRRQWRKQWPDCRLVTAERRLLGVVRDDDLPGSQAPAAWRDYLRGGAATNLRRVAVHNQQDLRSLAGIMLQLAQLTPGAG